VKKGPTKAEIRAVQKVVYKHARTQQIFDDYSSIDVLMHLNPAVNPPGIGPEWFVPDNGKLDPSITESVMRCRRISSNLQAIGKELKAVNFDSSDRKTLITALNEQAATWDARADAWVQNSGPSEGYINSTVAKIEKHQAAAAAAAHKVRAYLKSTEELAS
jgi:hypothetical protein